MSEPTPGVPADPVEPWRMSGQPVCPRHPGVVSYVSCQRCHRPTCPACQRPAAVGVHCVDCVAEAARSQRQATTRFGGALTDGRPVITQGIIALCVLVYIGQRVFPALTDELSFVPALAASEPWRFLTSAFAHSPTQLMHILFNMYAAWVLGAALEPALGRIRFIALYLLSALGGSVLYLLLAGPSDPLTANTTGDYSWFTGAVGASGAIFGLFGALLIMQRSIGAWNPNLMVVIGLNLLLPFFLPGIAWQAHVGGLLTGGAIGALYSYTGGRRAASAPASAPTSWSVHYLGLAAITVLLIALSIVKLTIA